MMPDYAFTEVPMPYDIAIVAKGAGTKDVQYSVVPSPKVKPLTPEEQTELNSKPTLDEVIEKLKDKQAGDHIQQEAQPAQPQAPQNQSGHEKAVAVANSLPGGNLAARGPEEPSGTYEDINVEDIPF